jgi:hypothetical protein
MRLPTQTPSIVTLNQVPILRVYSDLGLILLNTRNCPTNILNGFLVLRVHATRPGRLVPSSWGYCHYFRMVGGELLAIIPHVVGHVVAQLVEALR